MKYLIGIDGGGSGSKCVITDLFQNVLHSCQGGPTNILKYDREQVCNVILDLIETSCKKIGAEFGEISALVVGTAGAGNVETSEIFKAYLNNFLIGKNISISTIMVESDARIAIEGAFAGKPGIILIAGTGSIILGKNETGEIYRCGGFGRLIGDEGGGYSIGRKGLISVSKYFDGIISKTLIANLLSEKNGINSREKLIDSVYKNNFDISSVARLVIEAAEKNDPAATKVLDEESDELVILVKQMYNLLKMKNVKISFIGSLISNSNFYSRLLKSKIKIKFSQIEIVEPEHSPEMGAVILAKKILKN